MLLNIEKIKGMWQKLIHQKATPHEIASGAALGVFISFLPIPPFQTVTCLAVAWLFRANIVASMAGLHVNIIVFPAIPLVFWAELELGRSLLHMESVHHLDAAHISLRQLFNHGWLVFKAALLGSLLLAVPSAWIAYEFVRRSAAAWQNRDKQTNDLGIG